MSAELSEEFSHLGPVIQDELNIVEEKRKVVKNLEMFVLDNSLRESTVGQVRGHTLENKWSILKEVKRCGFTNIIVSAFSHAPRVDDHFVQQLSEKEPDLSIYYAFSEIGEGTDKKDFPVALTKMKKYKLQNPIFEIDLAQCEGGDFGKNVCDLLQERIDYTFSELCPNAKVFVNFRDFPFAMERCPNLVFKVAKFLAKLEKRPIGIMFEEPTGRFLPETMGGWTKALRALMDECDWKSAHLLAHIHKKWEFAEVVQLECLSSGADGVWASICEEGAALGHACSAVSIMNLIRLGNKKVLMQYNCTYLREAAINITKFTTGVPPHPKQAIYGERALDIAFGFGGIAGGEVGKGEFDMAKFFGIKAPRRMSTLATAEMVKQHMVDLFGEHESFTVAIAAKMKEKMTEDLDANRKEEYMSHVGVALLFDRAGGHLTALMSEAIAKVAPKLDHHKELLAAVRKVWDEWDLKEEEGDRGDNRLGFYPFYNAFMAPYFGCYECEDSKKGLKAIDMDKNGLVDWNEFCVYLKWALRQYPNIDTTEGLLAKAFTRGLIPAMQDELLKNKL